MRVILVPILDSDSSPDEIWRESISESDSTEPDGNVPTTPQVNLRRSTRKTAGKHANPFNLPMSARKESVALRNEVSYTDFSKAINDLGATMINNLGAPCKRGQCQISKLIFFVYN